MEILSMNVIDTVVETVKEVYNWFYNMIFSEEKITIKSCDLKTIAGMPPTSGYTIRYVDSYYDNGFRHDTYRHFTIAPSPGTPDSYYYEVKDQSGKLYFIDKNKPTGNLFKDWLSDPEIFEEDLINQEFTVNYFLGYGLSIYNTRKINLINKEFGRDCLIVMTAGIVILAGVIYSCVSES